jgi:hypothetical protein
MLNYLKEMFVLFIEDFTLHSIALSFAPHTTCDRTSGP